MIGFANLSLMKRVTRWGLITQMLITTRWALEDRSLVLKRTTSLGFRRSMVFGKMIHLTPLTAMTVSRRLLRFSLRIRRLGFGRI